MVFDTLNTNTKNMAVNIKGLSIFGVVILDLLVVIWLITFVGIKNFGMFVLSFCLGSFFWSLIIIATDRYLLKEKYTSSERWKKHLNPRWYRMIFLPIPIILGILCIKLVEYPFFWGFMTSLIIVLILIIGLYDILNYLEQMKEIADEQMENNKWVKKLLK